MVDYRSPEFFGIRTSDGLIRLIHGHDGSVVAEHHIFNPEIANSETNESWQTWLADALAVPTT